MDRNSSHTFCPTLQSCRLVRPIPIPRSNDSAHRNSNIHLKLENLQPSGSFKSRGIGHYLVTQLSRADNAEATHFFSSSGGNAGLACVVAARALKTEATVVVPLSTSDYMISKIKEAGASAVIQEGVSWAEADAYLRDTVLPQARNRGQNAVCVHPFDVQEIWDGHATMICEIKQQLLATSNARPDLIICSVGGGGLFNGIMQGLEQQGLGDVPVLAVETHGADAFAQALQKGELVTLPDITSIATSLGARCVTEKTLAYGLNRSVKSLVLQDKDAVIGCQILADKHRFLVETACGVCIAACVDRRLFELFPHLTKDSNVVVIVCGGSNVTTGSLEKYKKQYCC